MPALIAPASRFILMARVLKKTRAPIRRAVPRRAKRQDSYGCLRWSDGHKFRTLPGQRPRCAARPQVVWADSFTWRCLWIVLTRMITHVIWLWAKKGLIPVVPPKSKRKEPWEYDRTEYKKRNETERLFARIKRFRRIFTRYEKLDIMFIAFIHIALIYDMIICVNTP